MAPKRSAAVGDGTAVPKKRKRPEGEATADGVAGTDSPGVHKRCKNSSGYLIDLTGKSGEDPIPTDDDETGSATSSTTMAAQDGSYGLKRNTTRYNAELVPNLSIECCEYPHSYSGLHNPSETPTRLDIVPWLLVLLTWHTFMVRNMKPNLRVVQPSWLDKYLTEPPVTTARLKVLLPDLVPAHASDYYLFATASIREPGGLTFSAVVDVLDKVCQPDACRLAPYLLGDPSRSLCRVDLFAGQYPSRRRQHAGAQ
ncbi:hypothetical protein MBLNU13_g04091t2 [Cladosporium sp. NU13]